MVSKELVLQGRMFLLTYGNKHFKSFTYPGLSEGDNNKWLEIYVKTVFQNKKSHEMAFQE